MFCLVFRVIVLTALISFCFEPCFTKIAFCRLFECICLSAFLFSLQHSFFLWYRVLVTLDRILPCPLDAHHSKDVFVSLCVL